MNVICPGWDWNFNGKVDGRTARFRDQHVFVAWESEMRLSSIYLLNG